MAEPTGTPTFREPQVVLFVEDVDRSAAFYSALGFVEVFRTPPDPRDGEPIHVDLVLDGYRLGLASRRSTREDHGLAPGDATQSGPTAAVILWTDDVPDAYRRLVALGATGLREPYPWLGRLVIAWVADPDGHAVQVVQTAPDVGGAE